MFVAEAGCRTSDGFGCCVITEVESGKQQFLGCDFCLSVGVELFEYPSVFGQDAVHRTHDPVSLGIALVVVGTATVVRAKFLVGPSREGFSAGKAVPVVHG